MTLEDFPTTRPSFTANFARSQQMPPQFTFSRASTGTYVGENGLIQTTTNNTPRFVWENSRCQGLLIEEARTNYNYPSNDLSDSRYTVSPNYTTSNQSAPDGSNDAVYFAETVGASGLYINPAVSTQTFTSSTASVYVKVIGDRRYFSIREANTSNNWVRAVFDCTGEGSYKTVEGDVVTRTGFTPYIENVGDGWYRCSLNVTYSTAQRVGFYFGPSDTDTGGGATNSGYGAAGATGLAGSGSVLWGYQQEAGGFPTSLIPTTTAAVTRAADTCEITGTNFSSWYNSGAGTICATFRSQFPDGEETTILQSTGANTFRIFDFTNYNRVQFLYGSTNIYSNNATSGYPAESDFSSAAMFYTDDGTASSVGGSFQGFPVVSTTGTGGVTVSGLRFAPFTGASGALQASSAHLSRISYYPTRLPDDALEALTT